MRRDGPAVVNANEVEIAIDAAIENALNSQGGVSCRLSESGRNEPRAVVPFHLAQYPVAVLGYSHLPCCWSDFRELYRSVSAFEIL